MAGGNEESNNQEGKEKIAMSGSGYSGGGNSGHTPASASSFMIQLTEHNYDLWHVQMEDYLYYIKLWQPIFYKGVRPDNFNDVEWAIHDRTCLGVIRRYVDQSLLNHIIKETTTWGAWKILEETFGNPSANNKVMAIRKFVHLKYKDGTSMANHINEVKGIINLLNSMKVGLSDEVHALLILVTLPDSWASLSSAISNSSTSGTLSVKSVTAALLEEEVRRKNSEPISASSSNADIANVTGKGRKGRKQGTDGHGKACEYCGKDGHMQKDCWNLKRDKRNDTVKEEKTVGVVGSDFYLVDSCKCNKPECGSLHNLI